MSKEQTFPHEIAAQWTDYPNDDPGLILVESAEDSAIAGQTIEVGIYHLVRRVKVTAPPSIEELV